LKSLRSNVLSLNVSFCTDTHLTPFIRNNKDNNAQMGKRRIGRKSHAEIVSVFLFNILNLEYTQNTLKLSYLA
jgi:hypothetical protein